MAAPQEAKSQALQTLSLVEAEMPPEMRQLLVDKWRHRALDEVLPLVEAGWPVHVLARTVNKRSWSGIGSPGAVLVKRFADLKGVPVPNRDKAWTERDAQGHVVVPELCPHEAAGGPKACVFCRTGTEPETTAAESGHDPSMDGPPGPDSVREQLRAGRRKGRAS